MTLKLLSLLVIVALMSGCAGIREYHSKPFTDEELDAHLEGLDPSDPMWFYYEGKR